MFDTTVARALVVKYGDFLVNAVLNQRVHNRAICLPEKLSSMMRLFGYYNETVVIQYIAVEIVGSTRLLASGHAGTLDKD